MKQAYGSSGNTVIEVFCAFAQSLRSLHVLDVTEWVSSSFFPHPKDVLSISLAGHYKLPPV